jgi:hypothetical protein
LPNGVTGFNLAPAMRRQVMNDYRLVATFAVGRAVFFGSIAIIMSMLGMAFDFRLSLRVGAVLALFMSGLLLWFALTANRRRVESTETWLLLDDDARPKNDEARRVFRTTLKDTYAAFASRSWLAAMSMFGCSLLLGMAGIEIGLK